jgi:hypothetical protein
MRITRRRNLRAFRKQAGHGMTRIEKIIVVVLGLLSLPFLSYIISSWTSQTAAAAKADTSAKVNGSVLDDAHAAVQARLRNPGSAQFQHGFIIGTGNNRTVCGIVNAKNDFGGYSGYAPFVYHEPSKSVVLARDNDGAFKVNQSCTQQKSAEVNERIAGAMATLAKFNSEDQAPPDLQKELNEVKKEVARLKAWADRY